MIKKWLFCYWFHDGYKCYWEVWKVKPTQWHCGKCHSCGEELDKLLNKSIKCWCRCGRNPAG